MISYYYSEELFIKVFRAFFNNLLYVYIDGWYKETEHFKEVVKKLILNVCETNPTNKLGPIIHDFLKLNLFEKREYRKGIYKQIRQQVLPVLWKNHKAIERKKMEKLTFLANELYRGGQYTEAHIVETIVKPHIYGMNRKWRKMTGAQKFKTIEWKKIPYTLTCS